MLRINIYLKVSLSYLSLKKAEVILSLMVHFSSKLPDDWWSCLSHSNCTTSNYSRETLVLKHT